jgi:hypothetical protein
MRYIQYVGLSHQRMITAQDWQSVGIQGETVLWNAQNGFSVPLDRLTEEQIRKAIEPDAHFIITGDAPVPQSMDMVPAQAAAAASNPVDVSAMLEGYSNVSVDDSGASKADRSTPVDTTGGGPAPKVSQ